MNLLDIMILVVLLILGLMGWRTGLIKILATLIGVGAGTYLAGVYYNPVAQQLSPLISNPNGAKVAAFALVFVVVLVGVYIAGNFLRSALKLLFLGWLDSVLGAVAGLVVGSSIITVFLLVLAAFPFAGTREAISDSLLGSFFLQNFPVILGLLPEEFKDFIPYGPQYPPSPQFPPQAT